MTIQELANYSGIKEKTVKDNIQAVIGISIAEDSIKIPDGSRWPFDTHRYKLNTREKRIDALLAATYRYRYVDECMLNLTKESFNTMLKELVEAKLLQPNGSNNPYGANGYDTTMIYDQIHHKKSAERIKEIVEILASATGNFVGGLIG